MLFPKRIVLCCRPLLFLTTVFVFFIVFFHIKIKQEKPFLEGLFSPVEGEISEECEVVGELPEALNGEFARNGPNSRFKPKAGYHWVDGDGMVSLTYYFQFYSARQKSSINVKRIRSHQSDQVIEDK